MGRFHDRSYPGEEGAYREARDALLGAEIELRRRIEDVAAMRRALPLGGALKDDYVFTEGGDDLAGTVTDKKTRLSQLFEGGMDELVVYSFMYAPGGQACAGCTAFLDSLNGSALHIAQRVNLAVVAKAPIATIREWARGRGWRDLRMLSSGGSTYNADYFAETPDGDQIPALNVFRRSAGGIFHAWGAEMLYAPVDDGQHNRHIDIMWPLWNVLDLTAAGRGEDWFPATVYE
ncbi:MAG: DUF899 family protein [Rhodospirillales bacterium]|jgi:predicted dithiol-disulfide oxidoreductase (DUF899 family)|nr:DUF899 family protein [Rhodospirillales bacterium]MDP6805831.1 DUF899 family protein [Rhodospirillales bacterium]